MQLEIMLFFQSIRNSFLDVLMNMFSFFGEIAVPLIIITIVYWCIDKRKGFTITASLLTALITTQAVKAIVRYPRPFQAYPELISGERVATATGYSFPSGHSTLSSSFYSALCLAFRSRAMLAAAVILIIMIPISRLYLGVHWPMDVVCGTIIGLASSLMFARISGDITSSVSSYRKYTMIYGIAASAVSAVCTALLVAGRVDHMAFSDLAGNTAIAGGAMLGFALESSCVRFSNDGRIGRKALSVAVGIIGLAAVIIVIGFIPFPHAASSAVLMFMAGFWVSFLYPLIAVRLRLMAQA